ncbi:MAG: Uma2 family endonuclease [Isosphaeraceae bacterium]
MSTITNPAPPRAVVYPDSDGKRMAENTLQFQWIVTIEGGLETLYRNDPDVFVAGDLLWYAVEGNPKIRTAPDAMVAFGRPKGRRGSYKQWEEGGIPPHVVFEILSPGNRFGEMLRKFRFYERHGVEEYYIYNPDDGFLEGYGRARRILKAIPKMAGFVSPRLGIRFEPGEGPNNLKIIGPGEHPFATYLELAAQREVERLRAEEQAQLAQAEHLRAEKMAARLRELGIEPD